MIGEGAPAISELRRILKAGQTNVDGHRLARQPVADAPAAAASAVHFPRLAAAPPASGASPLQLRVGLRR
jgi:hypothetical protein